MSNKTYNFLKLVALVVLPALGTLYFALAGIWELPDAEKIIGSITAIDTFLGAALHVSSSNYKPKIDGNFVVNKSDPDKNVYTFELHSPVEELENKDKVTLGVTQATPEVPK